MVRHSARGPGRHRAERTSLLRSPTLIWSTAIGAVLFGGSLSAKGVADTANSESNPVFAWPQYCRQSNAAKLQDWEQKTKRAFQETRHQQQAPAAGHTKRLAEKHGLPIADATPYIKKLGNASPAGAVALANAYTRQHFDITTGSAQLNEDTVNEVRELLEELDETPVALVRNGHVDELVVQHPEPSATDPDAYAAIEWEKNNPTDEGTIRVAPGKIKGALPHELKHGFDRWWAFNTCGAVGPSRDLDIEAANPPGFTYGVTTAPSQLQGVVLNTQSAESALEDSAWITQAAVNPEEITNWGWATTGPITDKLAAIAFRYEETTPGLGGWLIDNMSSHQTSGMQTAKQS